MYHSYIHEYLTIQFNTSGNKQHLISLNKKENSRKIGILFFVVQYVVNIQMKVIKVGMNIGIVTP